MKMRITIGRRIGLGFAIFILLTIVAFVLTVVTLNDSKRRTETVVGEVAPSVAELKELNLLLQRSHTDISKWYYNKSFNEVEFREDIKRIINKEYPDKKAKLNAFAVNWSDEEIKQLQTIFTRIEALFADYESEIIGRLDSPEAYDDPNIYMIALIRFEESEGNIKVIYRNLTQLINLRQEFAKQVTEEMFTSINF